MSADTEFSNSDSVTLNEAQNDRLREHYLDELTWRIAHAWRRPRSTLVEADFSCQVQITRDAVGTILEVILESCNGDSEWQASLVRAIQSVSPIPPSPGAQPDESLHLGFTAETYANNSDPTEYEDSAPPQAVTTRDKHRSASASNKVTAQPRISYLTIIGDRTFHTVERASQEPTNLARVPATGSP